MPRGGQRNRSGPQPDETSGRSDQRGISFTALPTHREGEPPAWPLSEPTAREVEFWRWAWTTPQSCAWELPSEQWRIPTVAMWVRTFVICERGDATAADKGSLHRFADQIGMTTAGLREMGWKVAVDQVAAKAAEKTAAPAPQERRLRAAQ